ncbi:MAG TPA: lipid-binding SYLF domain-containing protein [Bryobacteraceae bacterium]|jgi:lipid-binding SYLF domain-containing protein
MKSLISILAAAIAITPAFAQKTAAERLQAATTTLQELMNAEDRGIPQDLLDKASCVVVVPNLKKGGFIVGAEYGKGFFTCRKPSDVGWSAPGSLRITGGKFGLLIGGAETDLVMLVMNKSGMEHLLRNKTQIGGELSAAAGPVGRNTSALTDAEMHAEILTWSRQRGIFGSIDLTGAAVTQDTDSNKELYGKALSNHEIIDGDVAVPPAARAFIRTLTRHSSRK